MEVDAGEVLGTDILSVGVQEIENGELKKREGYFGKTVQRSVVDRWDVNSGCASGNEEGGVWEGEGGCWWEFGRGERRMNGEVDESRTWVSFAVRWL